MVALLLDSGGSDKPHSGGQCHCTRQGQWEGPLGDKTFSATTLVDNKRLGKPGSLSHGPFLNYLLESACGVFYIFLREWRMLFLFPS